MSVESDAVYKSVKALARDVLPGVVAKMVAVGATIEQVAEKAFWEGFAVGMEAVRGMLGRELGGEK
jgi:hypothetical protein